MNPKPRPLALNDVAHGYDVLSRLYPHHPSLVIWRGWEYAAYRCYALSEPVLDVGCGDGSFFRLVWPEVSDATGVDIDPQVAERARQSGVYRAVHTGPAHELPFPPEAFASAFANCSLEHQDHLPQVLRAIWRTLRPGGSCLLSVVTDRFLQWATLPLLVRSIGDGARAQALSREYERYHHLVNPLPVEVWLEKLQAAGFEVCELVSIVPEVTSRLFLLLDHLWHVPTPDGELGDALHLFVSGLPGFPESFRQILERLLHLERDWCTGSGAVLWARRPA